MNGRMVIGVVEWTGGINPSVFVGDGAEQVRSAVVRYLWDRDIDEIDDEWRREHPQPDYDDGAAVEEWLDDLKATTADAWLTIYEPGNPDREGEFKDLRT